MNLGNLGEFAYCASCIQEATRRQGLGRLFGSLGASDDYDYGIDVDAKIEQQYGSSSSGGWWDAIGGAARDAFKGASSAGIDRLKREINPGAYERPPYMPPPSSTPGWVWPVAIGGGALALILLLRSGRQSAAVAQ